MKSSPALRDTLADHEVRVVGAAGLDVAVECACGSNGVAYHEHLAEVLSPQNAAAHPTSYDELAVVAESLPLLIREARRRRQVSIRAAADEIGCSPSVVWRLEHGKGFATQLLPALLRWLGTE